VCSCGRRCIITSRSWAGTSRRSSPVSTSCACSARCWPWRAGRCVEREPCTDMNPETTTGKPKAIRRARSGGCRAAAAPGRRAWASGENAFGAAINAVFGVAGLPSPVYSCFEMFPDGQHQGEVSRPGCEHAVWSATPRARREAESALAVLGLRGGRPLRESRPGSDLLPRRFVRENAGAKPQPSQLLNSKSAQPCARIL